MLCAVPVALFVSSGDIFSIYESNESNESNIVLVLEPAIVGHASLRENNMNNTNDARHLLPFVLLVELCWAVIAG